MATLIPNPEKIKSFPTEVAFEAWLAAMDRRWADFDDVLFYSDSTNDLPLLERVHTPIATNPTPALEAIASERGWRILKLFETP